MKEQYKYPASHAERMIELERREQTSSSDALGTGKKGELQTFSIPSRLRLLACVLTIDSEKALLNQSASTIDTLTRQRDTLLNACLRMKEAISPGLLTQFEGEQFCRSLERVQSAIALAEKEGK